MKTIIFSLNNESNDQEELNTTFVAKNNAFLPQAPIRR